MLLNMALCECVRVTVNMAFRRQHVPHEIVTFNEVVTASPNDTVHGILTSVSRVKKGRHSDYFDGTICDGQSITRVVGFHREQQKKMSALWRERKPVQLVNCEIKQSRNSEKMDVVLKSTTEVGLSTKQIHTTSIDVVDAGNGDGDTITLVELGMKDNHDRVDVHCKVMRVKPAVEVNGGKRKQLITVGDGTGVGLVVLWEEHIGALEEGVSYHLIGFQVVYSS